MPNAIVYLYKNIFQNKPIKVYEKLLLQEKMSLDEKSRLQTQRLNQIFDIAINQVPFYKRQAYENDITSFSLKDFSRFPLLNKEDIKMAGDNIFNREYKAIDKVQQTSSGGSTGRPIMLYHPPEQRIHGHANYLLANHLNGISPYKKTVVLWGAKEDMYSGGRRSLKKRIHDFCNNTVTLNTFILSEEIINCYILKMNEIKPEFIKAYVHSLYEIAKYINKNKIKINFKPVIHTTTGPLYPEMREEISQAFNDAKIFSFYGSREVAAIATETSEEEMNVLFDNVFVEVLNSSGDPVKKGEEGEIVISTLNNPYMPLLRYRIGDRAVKGDSRSGCLKLKKIVGRTLGVIHKKDGTFIDGQFFTSLFFNKKGIDQFQIIQKNYETLEIHIVKNSTYKLEELEAIESEILAQFSQKIKIDYSFPNYIPLNKTGKLMYVFSEIK